MSLPPPRAPPRKGPNPILLLGLAVLGSASFFILAEKRHNDQQALGEKRRREAPNPLLPSINAEKVELPPRRPRTGGWREGKRERGRSTNLKGERGRQMTRPEPKLQTIARPSLSIPTKGDARALTRLVRAGGPAGAAGLGNAGPSSPQDFSSPTKDDTCSSPTSSTKGPGTSGNGDGEGGGGEGVRGRTLTRARPGPHGGDTPLSPGGTVSNGFETPMITSPNVSNVAMHGSVFNMHLPFPRGMKHEQLGRKEWAEAVERMNVNREREGTATVNGTLVGTETIPEAEAEHEDRRGVPGNIVHEHSDREAADKPMIKVQDAEATPAEIKASRIEGKEASDAAAADAIKNDRVIAIDFDDVCSQNMAALINEHNAQYGTDLTVDDLQTYVFWQNRGWGTPAEVARKVVTLNQLLPRTAPVPGFADALRTLHSLGHRIHIITSRPASDRDGLIAWLAAEGITVGRGADAVIEEVWFTDTYSDVNIDVGKKGDDAFERELNERLKTLWRDGVGKGKGGMGKLKILRQVNASLFIDDHHGNLEPILSSTPPIPCLLFGAYGWNRSRSGLASPAEMMDYKERIEAGLPLPFAEIREGTDKCRGLHRARDWDEVVRWVKEWDSEATDADGRDM